MRVSPLVPIFYSIFTCGLSLQTAQAFTDVRWASTNCNQCGSTIYSGITTESGSGLFMETVELGEASGMNIAITQMYSNFVVIYSATEDLHGAISNDAYIQVTAQDHSTLYKTQPDHRIPSVVRNPKHKPFPKGFIGGYLYFSYDGDAVDLEVVVPTKNGIVRFPFSKMPVENEFKDPAVVKAAKLSANAQGRPVPADVVAPARAPVRPSNCDPAIETHIDGDFNGWDSESIYKMDDGSIWQQQNYHYHYHYTYHPSVLIYRSKSGSCHIRVDGDDDEGVDVNKLK